MLRADKIGIFTPLRGLAPKTAELLRSYRQFTFPSHHFSGIKTEGSVLAITIDCLKKAPVSVIMVTGKINGQTREFLIATAAPGKPIKEMIIKELDGIENVVAVVKGLTVIEQTLVIKTVLATSRPSVQSVNLKDFSFPFSEPDYAFQPTVEPEGRSGPLSGQEKSYLEYLAGEITRHWHFSEINLPGIEPKELVSTVAEALIRSNEGKLERLIVWGMLLPSDADHLLMRSREVGAERLTLMLMRITEGYLAAQYSVKKVNLGVKKLMPYYYIQYLAEKYADQGVTESAAWHFAVHNPNDPEKALQAALAKAAELARKYADQGVTEFAAWYFAVEYKDPEKALLVALAKAAELARKYADQGVTESDAWRFAVGNPKDSEKGLQAALAKAAELARKYADQGVTESDAWRFAVYNPNDPEKALRTALAKATELTKKYADQGVTEFDAWHFAVHNPNDTEKALRTALAKATELAEIYASQGVTADDAWYFAVHNPKDPEKAIQAALAKAAELARKYADQGVPESDAWRFAVEYNDPEKAMQAALAKAAELAEKYADQGVTESDAWYFAVINPKDPEKALRTALAKAAELAEKYADQGVTEFAAWHFAVNNPKDPEGALKKRKGWN